MIYHAPTINTLASLLQDPAKSKHCPPLFPINRGTSTAIFLAHGMGGDATQLFHVGHDLNVRNSIYVTQAPGMDGSQPLDSIEKMAAVYLRAIKTVQASGPYVLIGYSFGGLVMMEIAHRLQAEGEAIAFLAMIDTYPNRIYLRPSQQLPLLLRAVWRRLSPMRHLLQAKTRSEVPQSSIDLARKRIHDAEAVAWKSYRPRFYAGKVFFLRAAATTFYPKNARAVWAPLVQELELHDVPGDHTSLIAGQHKLVADLLTRQLKQIPHCKCVA